MPDLRQPRCLAFTESCCIVRETCHTRKATNLKLALSDLVEAYEAIHYPIPEPTPAGVVQGRMDALGLFEDDLANHLNSMEVASGILTGEIIITPQLADSLHEFLGIPVEDLLPEATPRTS